MANICPNCSSKLDSNNYCNQCNVTSNAYNKIIEASKLLYNEGLQKAKARDLSGAIETLIRSIKFDKKNSDARNLLGLVYYEIGETVLALRQWVVSKNIQNNNNIASEYLRKVQENQNNLDRLNTSIKKYNQALAYIQQGSTDLATIHLKKILTLHPSFVKAYCLLALVYVKEGENLKAKTELVKALSVDKSNYIARKYYEELSESIEEGIIISPEDDVKRERKRARRQVVINQSVQQFLGVVFGLAVGAALIYFLWMPNKLDLKDGEIEAKQEQIDIISLEIENSDQTIATNDKKIKDLELELKNALGENDQLSSKDDKVQKLMLTMTTYLEGNLYEAADYLDDITIADSTDGVLNSLYEQLVNIVYKEVATESYNAGYYNYDRGLYDEAIVQLEIAVKYITTEAIADDAHYFLGRCYQFKGLSDEAIERFKFVLSNFPDSNKRGYSESQIINLGGTVN